jgi:hypothetical protein
MDRLKNNKFVQKLKQQAEENPVYVLFAAAALFTATAKLMEANTQRGYQKAHAREIERRMFQTYNKTR